MAGDETDAIEVPLAPEGVLSRVRLAINRKPRRSLGFKVGPEFVGVVDGNAFEIWERRQHAVHLLGQVKGVRGGTRVELRTAMNTRTKVLVVLFFLVFALVAYGLATLPTERPLPGALSVLIAAVGAIALAAVFWSSARSQRAALRRFVEKVLAEELVEPPLNRSRSSNDR